MRQGTPGFIGSRLREGREARGITASALADVIGVTRAAMSQYEHGRQSPSPDAMRRLSDALNLPMQWFLKPMHEFAGGTVFYRCMSSATKGARLRAQRRFHWLKDIVELIQQSVRLPSVQLPDFDVPSDPRMLTNDHIEELATEARRFWGLKDGPISNMVWLLENRGIIVSCFDLHAPTLDAFSERDPKTKRPYVVLGDHKQSAARARFNAAHELGHLLLHRSVQQEQINLNALHPLLEKQAHRFAGAFLLPASTFGQEVCGHNLDSLRVLKERWHVAIAAMIYRAGNLRLFSEDHVKNLQINLARRKWRTCEPLDDILVQERPRVLKKCVELLVTRGVIPASEIPFRLSLPANDVEQLAGLDRGYLDRADTDIALLTDDPRKDGDEVILRFPFGQAQ